MQSLQSPQCLGRRIAVSNILDVTLRDGGYLNRWQFSLEETKSVLNFLQDQGLSQVEVGFLRTPDRMTSPVNGCPKEFLAEIQQLYPEMSLVCMLNPAEDNWQAAVADKLDQISLLRMPCTADLVDKALEIANHLKKQSSHLKISLNLICVSSYSLAEIECLLRTIAPSKNVDIVYLADSRGALYPHEVNAMMALVREICPQSLGFHAHDTLGYAIENSNQAFAQGCDWIDVTLKGFGLAGGNTPLGGYLAHHDLQSSGQSIQAEVTDFCQKHLPLRHPDSLTRQRYRLLAAKNIDPVWCDQLLEKYPDTLNKKVEKLPRQHYKNIDSVLDIMIP
ncbi:MULTISPECIES: hypothetical protein [unclassified Moorena]|uniref:hypothetical protein n=1 Tax=unclassified Moorena TaxID=2683338 RepID=UPI0013C000D4|nr:MULTISPECIES: hypothetical protein [unclassified Moorena]NEO10143.1 hypothetical protein [Moorena sp. SIO3I8]NEO18561.1 hypothetical protein [Moorena sp. SIO4A5]NEP22408.1 hypothetical protein [Moorena sp. SIO3I6]